MVSVGGGYCAAASLPDTGWQDPPRNGAVAFIVAEAV